MNPTDIANKDDEGKSDTNRRLDEKRAAFIEMLADEKLTDADKLRGAVLLYVFDHTATNLCFPSVPTIAKRVRSHPRSTEKSLARLKLRGHIATARRPGIKSNCYSFPKATPGHTTGGTPATQPGETPAIRPGKQGSLTGKVTRGETRKRVSALPETIPPRWIEIAEGFGLTSLQAQQQFDRMQSYWKRKRCHTYDLEAEWTDWLRREIEYRAKATAAKARTTKYTQIDEFKQTVVEMKLKHDVPLEPNEEALAIELGLIDQRQFIDITPNRGGPDIEHQN